MKGIFGDLFDFNSDGELDSFEQAADCMFLDELLSTKTRMRMNSKPAYTGAEPRQEKDIFFLLSKAVHGETHMR